MTLSFVTFTVILSSASVVGEQNQYTCGKDAVTLEAPSGTDPQCLQTWTLGNTVSIDSIHDIHGIQCIVTCY